MNRDEHQEPRMKMAEEIRAKGLTFGIEIETTGIGRAAAAEAIRKVVGGRIEYTGGTYDTWQTVDTGGRIWKAVQDRSVHISGGGMAEIVSPILTYDDIPTIQEVVRALRQAGARVDESCGIHIHVGAAPFGARALTNLVKTINKQEDLIEHALGISASRRSHWSKSIEPRFIQEIEARRPRTLDEINIAWYGYRNNSPSHYDHSRYHGVNLHNFWFRGTVEFRWFDATLHAGKIKAYIQLVLALANKALDSRAASSRKREFNASTARYDFRVFLLSLGMVGDEFKTARLHLLEMLQGSAAWKHGRPQQAQQAAAA